MAWSKTTRISVMLAIDIVFCLVELISGLLVHSLALMADAFHMLNDIISLCVGLWAVRVARKATTDKYSYGWVRAEILGAFFNAVFLIALCVSIVLEALVRFVDPPEIDNPKLILIVGCFGLLSNFVGFFVLGGHGHDHGPGDQEHAHSHDDLYAVEEGHARGHAHSDMVDEGGRVADVLPEAAVARLSAPSAPGPETTRRIRFDRGDGHDRCNSRSSGSRGGTRRRGSIRHSRLTSIDDMSIYPSSFRQEIIAASRPQLDEESGSEPEIPTESTAVEEPAADENTPLIPKGSDHSAEGHGTNGAAHGASPDTRGPGFLAQHARRDSAVHAEHNHNKPMNPSAGGHDHGHGHGHGHSHGDMGMNAMVLHVIGDALGNVGVIVTALIIWLTDWPGRYYADPAVSLFITLIILKTALPLTSATAKVLLQATPDHIDVGLIKEDIQALPGVVSCHHVHIWQLSDTKVVASMHIQVAFPISEEGGEKYMKLAKRARRCLHAYGIHSATIQPEFCLDEAHEHQPGAVSQFDGATLPTSQSTYADVVAGKCGKASHGRCLLDCVDDCVGQGCCSDGDSEPPSSSHGTHTPQQSGL